MRLFWRCHCQINAVFPQRFSLRIRQYTLVSITSRENTVCYPKDYNHLRISVSEHIYFAEHCAVNRLRRYSYFYSAAGRYKQIIKLLIRYKLTAHNFRDSVKHRHHAVPCAPIFFSKIYHTIIRILFAYITHYLLMTASFHILKNRFGNFTGLFTSPYWMFQLKNRS